MNDYLKSFLTTLVADFATDLALGLLLGLATLIQTGDWTQAAFYAIVVSSVRTALQHLRSVVEKKIADR